jgi:hypothetical protein
MPVYYHTKKIPKIGDKIVSVEVGVFVVVNFTSGASLMTEKEEYEGVDPDSIIIGYDVEDNSFDSRAILLFESGKGLKVPIQDVDAFIDLVKATRRDIKLNNMGI